MNGEVGGKGGKDRRIGGDWVWRIEMRAIAAISGCQFIVTVHSQFIANSYVAYSEANSEPIQCWLGWGTLPEGALQEHPGERLLPTQQQQLPK